MECDHGNIPTLQGSAALDLVTRDAHGLYAQFGFTALKFPERYMEILRLNVYRKLRNGRTIP